MSDTTPRPSAMPQDSLRAPTRLASMYFDVRERVVGTVAMLDDDQLATPVPACPEWTVHALVAHLVAMPMAIVAGDIPEAVMGGGDPNPWLAQLVADNQHRTVSDLARWWASDDDALAATLAGAGLLLADLFTHEGDLHGALGSTAHRNTPELDSQIDAAMAGLQKDITAAGLPPIAVDSGTERRVSADGTPGWTLRTGFWEAHRVFNSRRTPEEVLALPHDGDPSIYFDVMHEHLPLPGTSLGEH
jgi:hypothetical protein